MKAMVLEQFGAPLKLNNAEIARTLELVKHKRIKAVVNRTFPLEEAEQVHELLRKNAIAGRAALIVS